MKILVFDTCFNKTYIVLKENETVIASKVICSTEDNYHSVFLIPEIRNILKEQNILIKDLDAIGVNIGPGSFTGIRAGITIARVLAQQANLKLVGVESLKILSKLNKTDKDTIVLTDARKNKVYMALYNNKGNELISPQLTEKENITEYINNNVTVISDKAVNEYLKERNISSIIYEENDTEFGLYLAEIVSTELSEKNKDFNWAKVKPLYIQPPSITKPKELKNV